MMQERLEEENDVVGRKAKEAENSNEASEVESGRESIEGRILGGKKEGKTKKEEKQWQKVGGSQKKGEGKCGEKICGGEYSVGEIEEKSQKGGKRKNGG